MVEVESEILSTAADSKGLHKYAPEYGWRAWKTSGKSVDVVYWDMGNGWCEIMDVIPRKGKNKAAVVEFYRKLNKTISRCYDENGYRIA
ncbi:MAG: hypothetical protein ACK4GQ_03600 [Candidatus Hadarchaeales archaeon]